MCEVYPGGLTYCIDWNTNLIAFSKGYSKCPLKTDIISGQTISESNIMACKFVHSTHKRVIDFIYYHEDETIINKWTDCFGGLGASNDLSQTIDAHHEDETND